MKLTPITDLSFFPAKTTFHADVHRFYGGTHMFIWAKTPFDGNFAIFVEEKMVSAAAPQIDFTKLHPMRRRVVRSVVFKK